MKLVIVGLVALLCASAIPAFGEYPAGTNPPPAESIFQLRSVALNPETFIVTLTINAPRPEFQYGLLSHHGSPASNSIWRVVGTQVGGPELLSFEDNVTSSLTHSGITYTAFVSLSPVSPGTVVTSLQSMVTSVNKEFIAYPFLTTPEVTIGSTDSSNELLITYGEGIYSNRIQYTFPTGQASGFFRMQSPDNDPVNAVIQMKTNIEAIIWSNLPVP